MQLNLVLSENLKDLHQERECQRSARDNTGWWHFHQLFRQLRLANRGSRRHAFNDDLGCVNNLLGNRRERVEELEHVHQLSHHQRNRNVKRRHDQRTVVDLFHGVPLNPLLRPDLEEPVRLRSPEFFLVQIEEEVLRAWLLGSVCVCVRVGEEGLRGRGEGGRGSAP